MIEGTITLDQLKKLQYYADACSIAAEAAHPDTPPWLRRARLSAVDAAEGDALRVGWSQSQCDEIGAEVSNQTPTAA